MYICKFIEKVWYPLNFNIYGLLSSLILKVYFFESVGSLHGALLPSVPQVIPEFSIFQPQHWLLPNFLPSSSVSLPQLPWTPPHFLHFLLQHTALCLCSMPSNLEQSSLGASSTTKLTLVTLKELNQWYMLAKMNLIMWGIYEIVDLKDYLCNHDHPKTCKPLGWRSGDHCLHRHIHNSQVSRW